MDTSRIKLAAETNETPRYLHSDFPSRYVPYAPDNCRDEIRFDEGELSPSP
jgi:hypothetical protein